MRKFTHITARTVEEAVSALKRYGNRASIIAGGTDLLGKMKDEILPTYPKLSSTSRLSQALISSRKKPECCGSEP
jgi:CO/xanthine dehydrogenase FAD-binding subunit